MNQSLEIRKAAKIAIERMNKRGEIIAKIPGHEILTVGLVKPSEDQGIVLDEIHDDEKTYWIYYDYRTWLW